MANLVVNVDYPNVLAVLWMQCLAPSLEGIGATYFLTAVGCSADMRRLIAFGGGFN